MSEKEPLLICRSNPAAGNVLVLLTLLMAFVFYREGKTFPLSLDIVIPLFLALLWWGAAVTVGNIKVFKSGMEIKYMLHTKNYTWEEFSGYYTGVQTQYTPNVSEGQVKLSSKDNELHLLLKNGRPLKFGTYLYKDLPQLIDVVKQFLPVVDAPDFVKEDNFKEE